MSSRGFDIPTLILTATLASALGCGGGTSGAGADGASQDAGGGEQAGEGGGAMDGPADSAAGGDAAGETMAIDTWSSWADGFFMTYCDSCHKSGGSGYHAGAYDFTLLDKVKTMAATIRCGTAVTKQSGCGSSPAPKQFPIGSGPKPSDADRMRLVAWIDAGLQP